MPRSGWALAALLASLTLVSPARFAQAQDYDAPPIPSLEEEPADEEQESPEYYGGTPVEPPDMEEIPLGMQVYEADEGEAVVASGGVCWTLQFDAIFLRRAEQSVLPLVDGATPYGAQDLDLPNHFGPRFSLIGRNLYASWEAEFTYFSVDGWLAQRTSDAATTLFTTPAINFGARTVTSAYRESLYSTELNLRYTFGGSRFAVISGFRMIELQSDLFTDLVGSSHHINVNNHLYGYQLGGDLRFFSWHNFDFNTWLKAGIYGNAADQSTNIVNVGGAVPNYGVQGGRAAFVGEVGVAAAYRWNGWLAARAGYQAFWLDGLALAPDQIPVSNIATGVAALDTSKTLLYHGGFMGLEVIW